MSRPRPLPPAADHERHDALLVAQLVAGDPLEPEQQAEARRLVAGCGACAALAADLPAVSRLVAQEPLPPRRRDYRLSPEQAERLRGNAVTRFLRRLSLPSSRAFQPAAAGVLSIGLLFVVAGYAWPDGGTITVQAEPNFFDWSSAPPSASAEEVAEEPAAEVAEEPAAAPVVEPDPARDSDVAGALDGAAELMEESEFAESLTESQAGMSDGLAQKSTVEPDVAGQDRAAQDTSELPTAESLELGAAADAIALPADDEAAEVSARAMAPDGAAPGEGAVGERATLATALQEAADDDEPETLLIVLGLALAIGGGGTLLLGWLARRARDPLAP